MKHETEFCKSKRNYEKKKLNLSELYGEKKHCLSV